MSFHHSSCETCQETLANSRPASRATAEETHSGGLKQSRRRSISFVPECKPGRVTYTNAVPHQSLDAQGAARFDDQACDLQMSDSLSPGLRHARSPSPAESTSNCSGRTAVGGEGSDIALTALPNGSVARFGRPPSVEDDQLSTRSTISMKDDIKYLVAIDMQDSERYDRGYT